MRKTLLPRSCGLSLCISSCRKHSNFYSGLPYKEILRRLWIKQDFEITGILLDLVARFPLYYVCYIASPSRILCPRSIGKDGSSHQKTSFSHEECSSGKFFHLMRYNHCSRSEPFFLGG